MVVIYLYQTMTYFIDVLYQATNEFEKLAKGDPSAKVRNRGTCVFPAEHSQVKDNEDHFPINNEDEARNALARANQYSSAPEWYRGSLQSLVNAVARKVHSKYPGIEISEKSKKPGKD